MPIKTLRLNWKPFDEVLVHISHLSFCDSELKKGQETLGRTLGSFTPGLMISAGLGVATSETPTLMAGMQEWTVNLKLRGARLKTAALQGSALQATLSLLPGQHDAWPWLLEQLFSGGTFSPTQIQLERAEQGKDHSSNIKTLKLFADACSFITLPGSQTTRGKGPFHGEACVLKNSPTVPALGYWGHQFYFDHENSPHTLRVSSEDPRGT